MLESRPFGGTGLAVSEIGIRLAGPASEDFIVRAARHGCRLYQSDDPALLERLSGLPGAVVASGNDGLLSVGGRAVAAIGPRQAAEAMTRPGLAGVAVPFSFAEQNVSDVLPKLRRAKLGVIGTDPFAARWPEGGDRAFVPALVKALASLVKPRRTFRQAALQFALANQHLDCVIVEVATVEELEEALEAPEAEPLTIPDLERIFETYAHRHDDDPSIGCGGPP